MLAFGPLFACCVRRGVGRRQAYVARWPDVRYSATAMSCPPVVVVTPVFFAVAISMEQCDVLGTDALLEDDDIAIAMHLVALSFSHTPQASAACARAPWAALFSDLWSKDERTDRVTLTSVFFSIVRGDGRFPKTDRSGRREQFPPPPGALEWTVPTKRSFSLQKTVSRSR